MRVLTDHQVNGANEALTVAVTDAPGSGGANHRYEISGYTAHNPSQQHMGEQTFVGPFWNSTIQEAGVNGITHEILLSILADRLTAFQAGPFANRYNAEALEHVRCALSYLKARTADRLAQGIEGTHEVGTESAAT